MKAIPLAVLVACGVLSASAAGANQGPPPKPPTPINPAPNTADPTMPLAGLGAAAGAIALGAWFMRRGTTKPGG
jgi:hypothetical protein